MHIALLALNLVGLGLLVSAVAIFSERRDTVIESWEVAAEWFRTYRPDLITQIGRVSNDKDTALLELSDGQNSELGIVTVLGDKLVSRVLPPRETHIKQRPNGLEITLNDITFPRIIVSMNHDETDRWIALHQRLRREN